MRTISVALLLALGLSGLARGAEMPAASPTGKQGPPVSWGQEVGGWRLGVALSQSKFAAGDAIMVQATTGNLSGKERRAADYRFAPEMWDIQVSTVTSLGGSEAMPYTREGQRIYGHDPARPRGGSVSMLHLGPGESVSEIVWVNRVRDMTLQGKYSVKIGRRLPTESGEWLTVEGPPLEIEVKGTTYPDSALAQVLVLQKDPAYWEQAAVAFGSYVSRLVVELAHFAEQEHPADGKHAARTEFGKLRDKIAAMAKVQAAEDTPETKGEGQPEPTPASRARAAEKPSATPRTTQYQFLARVLRSSSAAARDRVLRAYTDWTVKGQGCVASATQEGDTWVLKLKAEETGFGGPIFLTVSPRNTEGKAMPLVGERVSFAGRLAQASVEGDVVTVTLVGGNLTPAAQQPQPKPDGEPAPGPPPTE